jgi:hypothetical protein
MRDQLGFDGTARELRGAPEMDKTFVSLDRLNREDSRRAQTRRVAGLVKVKGVD